MAIRRASFSGVGVTGRSHISPDINTESIGSPGSSPLESESPKILSVLSCMLERLIARNEQDFPVFSTLGCPGSTKLTLFHGLRPPLISVRKYLERIYKYTNCSPSCFVVAYVYIDRLVHRQPDQPVTSFNVHRLLITSVMLAAKCLDDVHYNNAFYARVGGISNPELNRLEMDLLFRLDFRVQVTLQIFESYCTHLERELLSFGHRPVERGLPIFGESEEMANHEMARLQKQQTMEA